MKKSLLTLALLLGFAASPASAQGGILNWLNGVRGMALSDTTAISNGQYMFARIAGGDTTFHFGTPAGSGGTVTSIGMTVPTGLSVAGSPVTSSGTLALSYAAGYQGYTSAEASKLSGIASGATNNPATTVGANLLNLTNPSAVRYIRINADNTVTARSASEMLSDLGGAPTASPTFTGTVTVDRIDGVYAEFDTLNIGVSIGEGNFDSLIVSGQTPGDLLTTASGGKMVSNSAVKVGTAQLAFFGGTLRSKITLDCPSDLEDFNPVTNTGVSRDCLASIVALLRGATGYGLAN